MVAQQCADKAGTIDAWRVPVARYADLGLRYRATAFAREYFNSIVLVRWEMLEGRRGNADELGMGS
jgi:hypothetical protein